MNDNNLPVWPGSEEDIYLEELSKSKWRFYKKPDVIDPAFATLQTVVSMEDPTSQIFAVISAPICH